MGLFHQQRVLAFVVQGERIRVDKSGLCGRVSGDYLAAMLDEISSRQSIADFDRQHSIDCQCSKFNHDIQPSSYTLRVQAPIGYLLQSSCDGVISHSFTLVKLRPLRHAALWPLLLVSPPLPRPYISATPACTTLGCCGFSACVAGDASPLASQLRRATQAS